MSAPIRLAAATDRAAVEEIVDLAYRDYVPRIGRKPGPMLGDYAALIEQRCVHLLDEEGAVVGLVVLIPEGDAMLLDNVAVRPSAKGRGLGRRLIAFAEQSARAAGCHTLRLYTHELMTENRAIYARAGFAETRRGEEKGLHRVFMAKRLAP